MGARGAAQRSPVECRVASCAVLRSAHGCALGVASPGPAVGRLGSALGGRAVAPTGVRTNVAKPMAATPPNAKPNVRCGAVQPHEPTRTVYRHFIYTK